MKLDKGTTGNMRLTKFLSTFESKSALGILISFSTKNPLLVEVVVREVDNHPTASFE